MEQVQALNIDVITGAINPIPRVKDAGDEQLWVTFESASHFNDVATREQGRPIFEMMEYIKIVIPGDTTQIIHRPVRPTDIERFPRQYQAFKLGREQQQGIPLSECTWLSRAQVDELMYFKIQTVEQLAGVSDAVCQKFIGLNQLKEKAKTYLAQMKGEEPLLKMQAELASRDEQLAAQKQQLEQMNAALKELQSQMASKQNKKGHAEAA